MRDRQTDRQTDTERERERDRDRGEGKRREDRILLYEGNRYACMRFYSFFPFFSITAVPSEAQIRSKKYFCSTQHVFRMLLRSLLCCVVCIYIYSYYLLGDNGRLQYLRLSLLNCMLMCFFVFCLFVCYELFVQRNEFNSG